MYRWQCWLHDSPASHHSHRGPCHGYTAFMRHRLTTLLIFLAVFPAMASREAGAQELSDGDAEFVLQLRQRGLTELAETHCRQQLASASTVALKTRWQLMLTDCHQDHLWTVSGSQRADYVTMAASQITDFLKEQKPGRNEDVELQVRQIEFLSAAARVECLQADPVVSDPDHSFQVRVTRDVEFGREVCRQARELLVILQKQIEQYRKEIDADVVRVARYKLRFAEAELLLSQIRLGSEPSSLLDGLQAQGEQLVRSSGEAERFPVRRMMTELVIARRDFSAFDVRARNALAEARTREDRLSILVLQMQALLIQGQPSEAIQVTLDAPAELLVQQSPEVQVLKLQALLQLNELLHQLSDDSKERRDSLQKSKEEFLALRNRLPGQLSGVYMDRVRRIAQRFDAVQQVGPLGATSLEAISDQVAAGQLKEAHAALVSLASKQSPGSLTEANVWLQAGDLSIKLRDWSTAVSELQKAVAIYEKLKATDRQSAADLLRIFAIGQQWNAQPDKVPLGIYRTSLDQHIQKYSDQPGIVKALEWRARLLRDQDPLEAAKDLVATFPIPAEAAPEKPLTADDHRRLCQLAELILTDIGRSGITASETRTSLEARFDQLTTRALQSSVTGSAASSQQLLQAFHLSRAFWRPATSEEAKPLSEIAQEAATLLAAMTKTFAARSDGVKNEAASAVPISDAQADLNRLTLRAELILRSLKILNSVRRLEADAATFDDRRWLLELPSEHREWTAELLRQQLATPPAGAIPGDRQLAAFLLQLLALNPESSPNIELQLKRLPLLLTLAATADQPGLAEEQLQSLMNQSLSDQQIQRLAEMLAGSSGNGNLRVPKAGREFWLKIQKQSRPGQPLWFEAAIQLAQMEQQSGSKKEALRILGVVEVLHPNWGSEERQKRAMALRTELEKTP